MILLLNVPILYDIMRIGGDIMISKDVLEKMYVNNNMTMKEISLRMDISVGTVFNYLKKYNIPTRKYKTEEQKLKISIANKGRISSRKGVSLSEDTKKKISESKKINIKTQTDMVGS